MMPKISSRNMSLPLRFSRNGLQLISASRTTLPIAFIRAASTSRLTPLFGISSRCINRFQEIQNSNKQLYRLYSSGLPEHRLIQMPALSPTMEHGTIVKWHKAEGDEVEEGDLICEIETDKSVMAFEASEEGVLAKILAPDGTKGIEIGKPICVFVDKKDDCAAFANFKVDATQYATTIEVNRITGNYPEHVQVGFPALSPTMDTGKLAKWHKQVGDRIVEGDLLCEIETDKSVMAFETTEEGFLAKIIIPEGTHDIRVGEPLCVICENKDDISAFSNYVPTAAIITAHSPVAITGTYPYIVATASRPSTVDTTTRPSVADTTVRSPETISTPVAPFTTSASSVPAFFTSSSITAPSRAGSRVVATPYARKLATDLGIDLSNIKGTGSDGCITGVDVESAKSNKIVPNSTADKKSIESRKPKKEAKQQFAPDQQKCKDIPLTNMRETIAKRLSFSKQTIPHYYLTSEIKMDELLRVRANLNATMKDEGVKISINDFIIKACALACMDVPEANSFFLEKEKVIRQNLSVDISVAVKTETGLITPIVHSANVKGLIEISREIKQLADKAQQNKLKPNEYMGGTFTVSNLGMFGSIHHFTAIINPPQSCILAVGGAEYKVVPGDGGNGFKTIKTMLVTMSCDHRVVDGAVGAVWLKYFKEYMEEPETILL